MSGSGSQMLNLTANQPNLFYDIDDDGFGISSAHTAPDDIDQDLLFHDDISEVPLEPSFEQHSLSLGSSNWHVVSNQEPSFAVSSTSIHTDRDSSSLDCSVANWTAYSQEHIERLDRTCGTMRNDPWLEHPSIIGLQSVFLNSLPKIEDRYVPSWSFPTVINTDVAKFNSSESKSTNKRVLDPSTWRSVATRLGNLNWQTVDDSDRTVALSKWRNILQLSPMHCKLGRTIMDDILLFKSDDCINESIHDALSMKATKTLHKRANAFIRFASWCSYKNISPMPIREADVYAFLKDCAWRSPGFGMQFCETLNFLGGVLGADGALEASSSSRVKGFAQSNVVSRKKKGQAQVLTVPQVKTLEILVSSAPEPQDRVMAGHCLFNLYARCRWSDSQRIEMLTPDISTDGNGFVEGSTYYTKTSNTLEKRRTFLPITAVTDGVHDNQWYAHWLKAREECSMSTPSANVPLMPAIQTDGNFGSVPLSPSLASRWLRDLLILGGHDKSSVSRISSHSLKATCLSWCSKAGVHRDHRAILGYHVVPGGSSLLHYSRDEQSEPLRQLAAVLRNIRLGHFDPDNSRSGYWKHNSGVMLPKPKAAASDVTKTVSVPNEHGLSSSSSSSSESSKSGDLTDEERAALLNQDLESSAKKKRGAGIGHMTFALHVRWRTVHTVQPGEGDKLSCGRPITVLYKRIPEIPSLECFKCRMCFGQDS